MCNLNTDKPYTDIPRIPCDTSHSIGFHLNHCLLEVCQICILIIFVCKRPCTNYILEFTSACGQATCDELLFFFTTCVTKLIAVQPSCCIQDFFFLFIYRLFCKYVCIYINAANINCARQIALLFVNQVKPCDAPYFVQQHVCTENSS